MSRTRTLPFLAAALFLAACAPEAEAPAADLPSPGADASLAEMPHATLQDPGPGEHLLFTEDVPWSPAPPSLEPEARVAILEGDPSQPGVFTMRIQMPDGFVIAPHSHPNVERVTVLQGTFGLGTGPEMDPDAVRPLPAGSYTSMPPGMVHYAVAQGETVVQLTSVGPWTIEYVNPEDDPRERADR
jgi:quercetin dioxygenase-like cupin family protein